MLVPLIIRVIHFFIMAFILITPFIGDEYWLSLHVLVVPFIMLHWVTNQTVCALTEMEKFARGGCDGKDTFFGQIFIPIYKDESFLSSVLKPVYKFEDEETERRAVWIGLTMLWIITLIRLWPTHFRKLRSDFENIREMLHI